jgi:DNA invertase Pin-like site-specific DNA recombinase
VVGRSPGPLAGRPAGFLRELHAKGVDLFLHQQGLDTSTPSGRAMFQMLGVFAEFERSMIRERVMACLSRAKADGIQLGRRRLEDSDAGKVAAIVAARRKEQVSAALPASSEWAWERFCAYRPTSKNGALPTISQ